MLVLVLTAVLAFFSRATLNRQIASSSVANTKVQLISQTAEAFVLDDFQREIEAGSLADANASLSVQIRRPIALTNVGIGVTNTWSPSMVPQRVGTAGVTNIVKVSRGGLAFFTNGPGYINSGATRASAVSSTTASANGRFLTKDRWNKPKLMANSETNAFVAPDWIYIDRQGSTPTDFSALAVMASSESANTNYVIGRYAYVVYDVGGLIDISVVGNKLSDAENSRRGRLNQVSLINGIPGVTDFADFVTWRSAVSSTNTNSAPESGGLFDPKRSFIDVPTGEQAFVNRQDLLAYVASTNTFSTNALPFLTTFSRDLNAPSYEPNSARSKLPATPVADDMNPALLTARFASDNTLNRPGANPVTVKAGTPVMPRRFPLSKLSLFEQADPDPAAMSYYFGLTKVDSQTWRYTATTSDGRIARLSEIAALGREPNFFEILQAVIYTGSLGKSGDDTYTSEKARDSLQNLHALQIGANIIDQSDANDIPQRLQFPSGIPGDYLSVFGVENLPYISQIALVGWRPTDDRALFQVWALFDVWNPHQNAKTPPVGIDGFRIVPTGGTGRINLYYFYFMTGNTITSTLRDKIPSQGGTLFTQTQNSANNIAVLNSDRNFSFSALQDYSEPTTLGTTPTSKNDTPGVLVVQCAPGIAIPQAVDRDPALQITVSQLETLTGRTLGVKAYNTCRLRSDAPPNGWGFALQAHKTGDPQTQWITYQEFENLGFKQSDVMSSPLSGETAAQLPTNTQFGSSNTTLSNEFYSWRSRGSTVGMIKADPRTNRLGLSGWSQATAGNPGNDFLGNSTRSLTSSLPAAFLSDTGGTTINNSMDWCFPGGVFSVGRTSPQVLDSSFEVLPAFASPPQNNRSQIGLYGLVSNNPDSLNSANPVRYSDPDGVIRPRDG